MDIVVFGPHDAEEIKAYIVDHHHRFSLEDPLKPGATYKILVFNLHRGFNWICKVDILVSGRHLPLHIPRIPRQHIKYLGAHTSDIPVVPFLVLLILKVQGWRDNCRDRRWDKIPRDIEDVNTLLEMTDEIDHRYYYPWLPKWFFQDAQRLVIRYTNDYPETAYSFRELGFDV